MHFFFFIFQKKTHFLHRHWYYSKITSLFVDIGHPLDLNIIFFVKNVYKILVLLYDIGCHMSYLNTKTACLLYNEVRPSLVIICLQLKFNNTTSINPPPPLFISRIDSYSLHLLKSKRFRITQNI